jgi:hypothetical protein
MASGAIWGPGLFITAWLIGGLTVPGYSPVEDHISSLAAIGAPSRMLMSVGFAAYAVGVGTAAWPLRRVIGNGASTALGCNALLVFGVLLTPEGISSAVDLLHGGFAFLIYLSLALVGPLAGPTFRRSGLRGWAIASLAVGAVTAVSLWISFEETRSGLFQRIGLTTTDLWLMALGIAFVTSQSFLPPVSGASVGGSPAGGGEGGTTGS